MDQRRTQAGLNLLVILLFAVIILLFLFPEQVGIMQDSVGNAIKPYGDEYGVDEGLQNIAADFSVYLCPPILIIILMVAWVLFSGGKND